MCTVRHQPYIPRGTEAIPRVRCSRQQGSEQKERYGDLARLHHRLVLESGHIHREEAHPIDAPPLVREGGGVVCESVDKADLLSDHFDSRQSREAVDLPLTCHPSPSLTTFAFRSSEVRRPLLVLDPYGGTDPLGMFHLFPKRTADVMAHLSVVFWRLVRLSSFPACWRQANVTPIPKDPPSSSVANY